MLQEHFLLLREVAKFSEVEQGTTTINPSAYNAVQHFICILYCKCCFCRSPCFKDSFSLCKYVNIILPLNSPTKMNIESK